MVLNKSELIKWYAGRPLLTACLLVTAAILIGCGSKNISRGEHKPVAYSRIQIDTIIPLHYPIRREHRVKVAGMRGDAYIAPPQEWHPGHDLLMIHVDGVTNVVSRLEIPIPVDPALDPRGSLADVAVNDTHICLLFWRALLIYRRIGDSVELRPTIVPLEYSYDQIALRGSHCFLGLCDISAREYGDHFTFAAMIDLESGTIRSILPLPDPEGFQFTSFVPRRIMEFTRDEILVADIPRYRINVYDHAGKPVALLERRIDDWERTFDTGYRSYVIPIGKVPFGAKGMLDSLRPYVFTRYMIRLIDLVDDSTLMVAWQSPGKHESGELKGVWKVYYDIWRASAGKWSLVAHDLPDFSPQASDSFDTHTMMPLFWTYHNLGNSRLGRIAPIPEMNMHGSTFGEIQRRADSIMAEGDPPYSLIRYKVSP